MENKKTRRFHFSLPELVFLVLIIISAISTGFHSGGFVVDLNRVGFSILSSMQKGVHTVTSAVVNVFTAVQPVCLTLCSRCVYCCAVDVFRARFCKKK